ncbi:hypothetical protein F0U47_14970 [Nocardioides antri]|uniref:TM2 domain-containing protein n=2 Tax=Nocardioides antri TaxID=2607659 RepID=A0A5B1M2G7_9ACTN|nr:hypothetical protein F0U47_14970 [Nocardioides antri]
MFRPPEPTQPPAAPSPPPAAPTGPPPPTGGAPYQPPPAPYQPAAPGQGYQPYGTPQPVPGGFALPGAKVPGQMDPESGLPFSDKERLTAGLLQLIPSMMGIPGIGRLYTGHTAIGLIQLIGAVSGWVFTCILIGLLWAIPLWIWGVVDGILMLTNKRFTDAQGRVLR